MKAKSKIVLSKDDYCFEWVMSDHQAKVIYGHKKVADVGYYNEAIHILIYPTANSYHRIIVSPNATESLILRKIREYLLGIVA
jgi:hypothetical protein